MVEKNKYVDGTILIQDIDVGYQVKKLFSIKLKYFIFSSGIDVDTEKIMQMQEPMIAIVIDPKETMTSGKVEIGAFRTFS